MHSQRHPSQSPPVLRLWDDDPANVPTLIESDPYLSKLGRRFEDATGWVLRFDESLASFRRRLDGMLGQDQIDGRLTIIDMSARWPAGKPAAHRGHCDALVDSISELLTENRRLKRELQAASLELGTRAATGIRRDHPARLAEFIQQLLHVALEQSGYQSAAVCVFDDSSQSLVQRFAAGPHFASLVGQRRGGESAKADTEAMLGAAITLSTRRETTEWNVPARCVSAICVPISSMTHVLGTLWLASDRRKKVSDAVVNTIELVAGRLASELERESLFLELLDQRRVNELPSQEPDRQRPAENGNKGHEPRGGSANHRADGERSKENAPVAPRPIILPGPTSAIVPAAQSSWSAGGGGKSAQPTPPPFRGWHVGFAQPAPSQFEATQTNAEAGRGKRRSSRKASARGAAQKGEFRSPTVWWRVDPRDQMLVLVAQPVSPASQLALPGLSEAFTALTCSSLSPPAIFQSLRGYLLQTAGEADEFPLAIIEINPMTGEYRWCGGPGVEIVPAAGSESGQTRRVDPPQSEKTAAGLLKRGAHLRFNCLFLPEQRNLWQPVVWRC